MNLEKTRRLKIEVLPDSSASYETRILVLSVSPCEEGNLNLEIKVEEWILNWN